MKMIKKTGLAVALCLVSIFSFAQTAADSASQDRGFMYSEGKIYVVIAVVLVILIGLFLYLFNLDRKISKLEKEDK